MPLDPRQIEAATPGTRQAGTLGDLERRLSTLEAAGFGAFSEAIVSTLPANPRDGQVINYLADGTAGIVWRLRYRAASASAYKWELVGGGSLMDEVATTEQTASTSYVALATAGPTVTPPLAGDYLVELGAHNYNSVAGLVSMSFAIGAAAAAAGDGWERWESLATGSNMTSERRLRKTSLAANAALAARYKTGAGTATFYRRWMRLTPVRVG